MSGTEYDMARTRSRQADPRQQLGYGGHGDPGRQWGTREQNEQVEVLNQQFQAGVAVQHHQ